MMEETARVIAVHGTLAEVEALRRSACGGCAATSSCGTSLLERYFGRRRLLLEAHNAIGAQPGEEVVVGLSEDALVGAAFATYLVPLAALIVGAIAGSLLASAIAPWAAQGLSIVGGSLGFAGSLWWLGRFSRRRAADARYRPVILRRPGGTFSIQIPFHGIQDKGRSGAV
jgi:sigma-E factor negative regulatory protein RseC